ATVLRVGPAAPHRVHPGVIHREWSVADAAVYRIHHSCGRRTEVTQLQRMAVLVQRDRLHVDPREREVDAPRVARSVAGRIAEGVVVVDFVQRRVEVVVAVDIGRDDIPVDEVDEDKGDGERDDAPAAARTPNRLEEGPGEEACFDDVGCEGVAEPAEAEEGSEDRDRKSTRLNSSHVSISYAVFCLKKKI